MRNNLRAIDVQIRIANKYLYVFRVDKSKKILENRKPKIPISLHSKHALKHTSFFFIHENSDRFFYLICIIIIFNIFSVFIFVKVLGKTGSDQTYLPFKLFIFIF